MEKKRKFLELCLCETLQWARWSPLQSPGRSDHSRDDSLIADDASSTGNKDDDDDDDEDDANDENDGFSRDPERLKAFNVSNGIDTDICFNVSTLECFFPTCSFLLFLSGIV